MWGDSRQEMYFRITMIQESSSPNRNQSNGVWNLNRYHDENNLYYSGIRVDGKAVIKKKIDGKYYTMATKSLISNSVYNRDSNATLLPLNVWIGLRSEIITDNGGVVHIIVYTDIGRTGNWKKVVEAFDNGATFGKGPFENPGHAGIRTDFMDVQFDDYTITSL